ncbi:hypothetical protein [Novosphingobium album (ex Hu et al. 2023)]|uniref:DUF560 domain-containing protein n=1 Tax=Novosphingobium album (ex Hu et al. 2023) TaxID=2930093 RepID=A0ABT0B5A2_9SPHN|nr:hypothetical protein [Novosphingobium album (ex Hu et al. 2023)]MCJ2180048.1 hypothetical protein [Novosphingobium album (ex Hu et al. 2023)]
MIKAGLVGVSAVSCAILASPACAQSAPLAAQQPHTDVVLSARGLYDGNVIRGSAALADQRGLEKDDFRLTPSIDADIYKVLGTGYLSLNGSVGYDFYARNTRLNRERIATDLGAGAMLGPCGVDTTAGFSRSQSELADLNTAPDEYGSTKNTETRFNVGGMVACGSSVGFKPFAVLQASTARNSSTQRKGSDFDSITYGGGVMYAQPSIGEIRVFATGREVDFDKRDQVVYFGAPKLRVRTAGGQFSRDIGARLSAFVLLAYTEVNQKGIVTGKTDFNGLTWQGKLTLKASERMTFQATVSQDTIPSLGFNVDYMKRTDYAAQADFVMNSRMTLRLSGSHGIRNFYYSALSASENLTHDRVNTFGASFRITPVGPFTVSLDAIYDDRKANLDIYSYNAVRAGISLQMKI